MVSKRFHIFITIFYHLYRILKILKKFIHLTEAKIWRCHFFVKIVYNFKLHGVKNKQKFSLIIIFANLSDKNNSHNSFQTNYSPNLKKKCSIAVFCKSAFLIFIKN